MTLPEGVSKADVADHAVTLQLTAELINATSAYMTASGEAEAEYEEALDRLADTISRSPHAAGSVMLALASLVCAVAEPDDVQTWFTEHGEHVKEALGRE